MRDLLPTTVFEAIRGQYRDVEPLSAQDFDDLQGDEDSITGALQKGLAASVHGSVDGYSWITRVKKLRGRGLGAPESTIGADMVIELEIALGDGTVQRKGLLVQAKKEWNHRDSRLVEQAQMMEDLAPGLTVVIDYRRDGRVLTARSSAVIASGGRPVHRSAGQREVGALLADEFLECEVGKRGMYYDARRQILVLPQNESAIEHSVSVRSRVRTSVWYTR